MAVVSKQWLEGIRLWLRLKQMDPNRITAKVFQYGCNQASRYNIRNWEFEVMSLFTHNNLNFLTNMENVLNVKSTVHNCKTLLSDIDEATWHNMMWDDRNKQNGNKLRSYRTFKDKLEVENYVKLNMPWYKKRYYAMLRAGCLPLEIEKGRFRKPPTPLNERICKLCELNVVEDEHHFILDCTLYADLRDELFIHCSLRNASFMDLCESEKFKFVMSLGDYQSCNIIYKMYMRRNLFV